jgi:hypothetical protein
MNGMRTHSNSFGTRKPLKIKTKHWKIKLILLKLKNTGFNDNSCTHIHPSPVLRLKHIPVTPLLSLALTRPSFLSLWLLNSNLIECTTQVHQR